MLWNRDFAAVERHLALLEEHALLSSSTYWRQYVDVFRLGLLSAKEQQEDGIQIPIPRQEKWDYRHWENFSVLGEGFAPADMLERAKSDSSWWCAPEILRLEAMRLYRDAAESARQEACALLRQALGIAQNQQALAWELRVATSLLEIAQTSDEVRQAKRLLKEAMSEFTEGLESHDLQRAETLLAQSSRFIEVAV